MKNRLKFLFLSMMFCIFALHAVSQNFRPQSEEKFPEPQTRILFIFDCSQSMFGRWQSDTKINIAQKLLSNLLDSLKDVPNLEMALRVYGHQKNYPPQDCNDTKLEVPFAKDNYKRIIQKIKSLVPRGTTPIASSLEKCADDFPLSCPSCRNVVVLITDGIEECDGDPCAVSVMLQKKGIILKPFIIGIGKNFKESFDCVGNYYDATSEVEFSHALNVVISQALNSTTAQVNLLDESGKPTETNVNMTFYDNFSGIAKYNFIHTLNNRGMPDTLVLDPLIKYNIVVHTIPAVRRDSVEILPGKHTIIPIETPQGQLKLKLAGNRPLAVKDLLCIIRKNNEMQTLNVQSFNQTERYLTGKYDLEVLCLPRLIIKDVEIKQSTTTTVEIPMPGIAVINKIAEGTSSLYLEENNVMKWLYNLDSQKIMESLVLQPGRYHVVFRSKYSTRTISTIDKTFTIESGSTTTVNVVRENK